MNLKEYIQMIRENHVDEIKKTDGNIECNRESVAGVSTSLKSIHLSQGFQSAEGAVGYSAEGAVGYSAEGAVGYSAEGAVGYSAEGAVGYSAEGAVGYSAEGAVGYSAEGAVGYSAGYQFPPNTARYRFRDGCWQDSRAEASRKRTAFQSLENFRSQFSVQSHHEKYNSYEPFTKPGMNHEEISDQKLARMVNTIFQGSRDRVAEFKRRTVHPRYRMNGPFGSPVEHEPRRNRSGLSEREEMDSEMSDFEGSNGSRHENEEFSSRQDAENVSNGYKDIYQNKEKIFELQRNLFTTNPLTNPLASIVNPSIAAGNPLASVMHCSGFPSPLVQGSQYLDPLAYQNRFDGRTPVGENSHSGSAEIFARALATAKGPRKPRGEKIPMPSELKDTRYYERRKRNNAAAKKSRDARKRREDEATLRANYLEKENDVLREQVRNLQTSLQCVVAYLLRRNDCPPPNLSFLSSSLSTYNGKFLKELNKYVSEHTPKNRD